jgi:hypothetical protein
VRVTLLKTKSVLLKRKEDSMGYVKGVRWNDDLIKDKVFEVMEALSIDRMPSEAECKNHFHDCRLSNAIIRRGGFHNLAHEMGLPVKNSETYFGKKQEEIALEMLVSKGFTVRRMSQNFPYDLLVDDCVKVDVKASHLYKGKNGSFYTFNLEKPYATCDVYLLFALDDKNEIDSVFVVPSKFVIANTQISIGEHKSKYHRFRDCWEYIESVSNFWDSVS